MEGTSSLRIPQPDAEGNYDSPPLAAVRRCWQDFLDGHAAEADLELTLQAFADRVSFELEKLDQQVEAKKSDANDPIFASIVAGFEQQLNAAERMLRELDEPDIGHMEAGLELAQRANNRLMQAHQQLVERESTPPAINCVFCGAECTPGASRCTHCNRPLPVTGESQGQSSSFSVVEQSGLEANLSSRRLTQNAAHIMRAVDAWKGGKLDWESLYTVLDEIEDKLLQHQEANQSDIAGNGDPSGLLARTDALLEESLAAVDHMRLAWDKDDQSYLETGLGQFCSAGEQLLSVMDEMKQKQ
jgi:hypothetical protein